MALSFGVTVLPDPPASRLVELMQLGERNGFEIGWTYDSHVLWQESFVQLTMAIQGTSTMKFGHLVTNPGTREPTVLASLYATMHDISDGRMVMGIGRGDSARRYIGQQPVRVAEFERRLAMIKPFMNGKEVQWNDKDLHLKWVRPELPEIPMWVAGYGPKALAVAGRVGDGVIIQLADPEIIQWIMGTARAAAEEAGRDPAALKCIVCAPSHVGPIEDGREQTRWFPAMVSNHVKDLIERYGTDGSVVPHALTDYVEKRKFYDYDEHSRVGAKHGEFVTDEICDRFSVLGDVGQITTKLRELESIGVDHFSIYLMTHGQEATLAGLRGARDPGAHRDGGIDARQQQLDAWRAVAPGWERQRALFWEATRPVSERLVELLGPRPGQTIVDLAAGPGDTGFLAAPLVRPGGRLVTTDVAPEMLDTARRRAVELGLDDVEFRIEDIAALSFDDATVDGILCRWGLMLVPDMDAAAAEIRRVLRAEGRAALAVWGSPDDNDWMTAPGRSALELGLVERPDPAAPGPFRLSADGALAEVLRSAGLTVETVDEVRLVWRSPSLDEWWDAVRDTSRMLSTLLERLSPEEAQAVREGAERRLGAWVGADGSVAVPGVARVALAARPD